MKQNWKNRISYFWEFYKWPCAAGLVLVIACSSFLYAKASAKETELEVMLFDCYSTYSDEELAELFAENMPDLDTETEGLEILSTLMLADKSSNYAMTCVSRFYTDIGTGDLDVCGMLEEDFETYSHADSFLDLSTVFTEAELKTFPRLYKSEAGKIIGVYADDLSGMQEADAYTDSDTNAVIGIAYNSGHVELARSFLLSLSRQ